MQFSSVFFIVFSVVILQACSSGNNKPKSTTEKQAIDSVGLKENFPKGQIIDKVVCKNDTSQNYAMYLPSTYSTEKNSPVIYAFDPHGNGKIPVEMYKDLAEQYGFIILGSNNSKNGNTWEESQTIATKLFADAGNRLAINTQRIYLLGFSGGARVANGLTISNGFISGVICCGAATPAASSFAPRGYYSFLGLVGNEDFNYTEMKKYDLVELAGHNLKHIAITFDGKHEWPAEDIMDEAFWWLELNDMRKDVSKKNDSLISKRFNPIQKQIENYLQNKQEYEAYNLCRKTITFYDGLADLTYYFTTYKSLQTNHEIDRQLKLEEISWKKEEDLKQYYMKALQTQRYDWWATDIAGLNKELKKEKNRSEALVLKRTLAYLSLVTYMQASGALDQNNTEAAEHFCKIYVLVDPTNNEAHYLTASLNAKKGNIKGAVKSLNEAVNNGFTDVSRLQKDSTFSLLKAMDDFNLLFKKIGEKGN